MIEKLFIEDRIGSCNNRKFVTNFWICFILRSYRYLGFGNIAMTRGMMRVGKVSSTTTNNMV